MEAEEKERQERKRKEKEEIIYFYQIKNRCYIYSVNKFCHTRMQNTAMKFGH